MERIGVKIGILYALSSWDEFGGYAYPKDKFEWTDEMKERHVLDSKIEDIRNEGRKLMKSISHKDRKNL